MTREAFVQRETAISVVINAAISGALCWLIFSGEAVAPAWTMRGIVADTLPQGFMVALMGTLVPALLARKVIARGVFGTLAVVTPLAIARQALIAAVLTAIVATAVVAIAFGVMRITVLPFSAALVLKVSIGAAIALIVTPRALRAALATREAACA